MHVYIHMYVYMYTCTDKHAWDMCVCMYINMHITDIHTKLYI